MSGICVPSLWCLGLWSVTVAFPGHTLFFPTKYGKCSKISNPFLILFSNKMLVIKAGIHKMLVRIANREDTDQQVWVCTRGRENRIFAVLDVFLLAETE